MSHSIEGIGERIAEARRAIELTQDELAAKLSITPQAISKWERGTGLPDISILPSLASALGVAVGELFGEKANQSQSMPYTFSELPLVASSNNIGCYSDKTVNSADESSVKFTDGSVADYATQTVTNKGAGDVRLVEFDESTFHGHTPKPTTLEKDLEDFENLDLTFNSCCNVEIIGKEENKRGILASGSPAFISRIDSSLRDGTLYLTVGSGEDNQKKENNKLTIYTDLTRGKDIKLRINGNSIVSFGIPFESADIIISGAGDVFAKDINTFSLAINGGGNVNFASAVTLNTRINGSGDITFDCIEGSASVAISGAGDVRGEFVNDLNLQINGSGDVSVREVGRLLTLHLNGEGDVKCGGEVGDLLVTVGGVGKIDLKQLEARNARIDLSGVADVTIGRVTVQSVERISKRSSFCVLKRG